MYDRVYNPHRISLVLFREVWAFQIIIVSLLLIGTLKSLLRIESYIGTRTFLQGMR